MNQQDRSRIGLRRWALAAALAPLAIAVSSLAIGSGQGAGTDRIGPEDAPASAAPGGESPDHRGHGAPVYSVINLPVEAGADAYLNEKGQVAFSSFIYNDAGFFDGDRMHGLGSLGGGFAAVRGLNNLGTVVGESNDASQPHPVYRSFVWTAARGMRALPGPAGGMARAINDRNQVVGDIPDPRITARAVRWDPGGRIRTLGPAPLSLSEARDINELGMAAGFADVAGGSIHAMLWDASGRQIDLGTMGGTRGFTFFVNRWGAAVGISDTPGDEHEAAFYWSPRGGRVPIGAQDTGFRLVTALNDRGDVSGNTLLPSGYAAYFWTRSRGMTLLPGGGAGYTDVLDLNNRGEMVGQVDRAGMGTRAVRWPGLRPPIDLTSRIHRPPAGLVIHAATAINDAGVIAAHSNAGIILLRPGARGTDAPVLGPIAGLPDVVELGQELRLSLSFVDNSATQTHKARVEWSDGCASSHPAVRESRGVGTADFQHRFCAAGFHTVTAKITDSGGRFTVVRRQVYVNETGLAAVSGRGTLPGAGGADTLAEPLRFALWAPLSDRTLAARAGAGASGGFLRLSGPFQFSADQLGTATRSGNLARLAGTGRYNGRPGYRFLIEATDEGQGERSGKDLLHVRISHRGPDGREELDYDNGPAAGMKARLAGQAWNRTALVEGGLRLHD